MKLDANHHLWSKARIGQRPARRHLQEWWPSRPSPELIKPDPLPQGIPVTRRPLQEQHQDVNFSEMLNIGLMQGFAGLSLFSVLLLMGLGLAIIFGQMGVINMAHGEFMTIGAYTIFLGSTLSEKFAPGFIAYYFPVAIGVAFVLRLHRGWVVEWALIRHLYKRPLDTLLATWGLSLGIQQLFRTGIGPKEVSPTLPDWLLGSWAPHPRAWTSRSTACSCSRSPLLRHRLP